MVHSQIYSITQLRDIASVFSRNQVQAWQKGDFSGLHAKIVRYFPEWLNRSDKSYFDYLRTAYSIIRDAYPNEYIYKNDFLTAWIIQELGKAESKVYSEFRVGKAVADLVLFNGTSKAFEIKTELDSDNRLTHQLASYQKAFNEIYLIVPASRSDVYENLDSRVGIITYNNGSDKKFSVLRKSQDNRQVDSDIIMETLHTHEYKQIIKQYFGALPQMNSFTQFECCKTKMKTIPAEHLNQLFIKALKNRKQHNAFSKRYYPELNQISLSMNLSKLDRKALISGLLRPITPQEKLKVL
ncbi:MAG: sce7726 family protein [Balneolales bacterium]|nr:sce7726 family protein [Balneolales bacterium]